MGRKADEGGEGGEGEGQPGLVEGSGLRSPRSLSYLLNLKQNHITIKHYIQYTIYNQLNWLTRLMTAIHCHSGSRINKQIHHRDEAAVWLVKVGPRDDHVVTYFSTGFCPQL